MIADPLSRPLGIIERFYWLIDQRSCTNFVLAADLDAGVSPADLERALHSSWARHPRLRCRIAVTTTGRVVLEPDRADPPRVAPVQDPWRAVADAELGRPFPPGSHPLIRCHWVAEAGGSTAIFTFNHGLLDAGSAARWMLELLAEACGHPPSEPFPTQAAPSEHLYPARHRGLRGVLGLLRMMVREGLTGWRTGAPRALPGAPPCGTPRQPCTRTLALPPARTEALIHRCRQLGCTVQGALMAAQAHALRGEFPGDGALPVGLAAAMDLRPWLAPPLAHATLGNHVSLLSITVKVGPSTSLDSLAVRLSREVRTRAAQGLGHLFWRLVPPAWFLPPDARSLPRLEAIARAAPPSTVVTNLGRLPQPPPALSQRLRALHFTMAPQPGSPLCTGAVTLDGALHLDLCFDAAHLDDDGRSRIVDRFERAVAALMSGADSA